MSDLETVLGSGKCYRCKRQMPAELPLVVDFSVTSWDLRDSLRSARGTLDHFGDGGDANPLAALAVGKALGMIRDPKPVAETKTFKLCFRCAVHVQGAIDSEHSEEEIACGRAVESQL
jgi:hypothetical protein